MKVESESLAQWSTVVNKQFDGQDVLSLGMWIREEVRAHEVRYDQWLAEKHHVVDDVEVLIVVHLKGESHEVPLKEWTKGRSGLQAKLPWRH